MRTYEMIRLEKISLVVVTDNSTQTDFQKPKKNTWKRFRTRWTRRIKLAVDAFYICGSTA